MADKDFDGMIEGLKPVTAQAFTVTPDNPRALPAGEYADHFRAHGIPAAAYPSVPAALAEARAQGRPVLCLGSLYLYRAVRPFGAAPTPA